MRPSIVPPKLQPTTTTATTPSVSSQPQHQRSLSSDSNSGSSSNNNSNLVHKLLFPGFSQSGSNDLYQPHQREGESSRNSTNAVTSIQNNSLLDESGSSSVGNTMSQAETELHDNRTTHLQYLATMAVKTTTTTNSTEQHHQQLPTIPTGFFTRTPQPQRRNKQTLATTPTTIRMTKSMDEPHHHAAAIAGNNNNNRVHSSNVPPPVCHSRQPPQQLPPLFASTKPKHATTAAVTAPIPSPPVLARRPMAAVLAPTSNDNVENNGGQHDNNNNQSAAMENNNAGDSDNDDPPWEEEATPAQTAFGKQLLLARPQPPSSEAALSTASEMGTVINVESRLADLDHELLMQGEFDMDNPEVEEDKDTVEEQVLPPPPPPPYDVPHHQSSPKETGDNNNGLVVEEDTTPLSQSRLEENAALEEERERERAHTSNKDDHDHFFRHTDPSTVKRKKPRSEAASSSSSNEILSSTASEMGTVINANRLAELDHMAEEHDNENDDGQDEVAESSLSLPCVSPKRETENHMEQQQLLLDNADHDEVTQLRPRPSALQMPPEQDESGLFATSGEQPQQFDDVGMVHPQPQPQHVMSLLPPDRLSLAVRQTMAAKQQQQSGRSKNANHDDGNDENESDLDSVSSPLKGGAAAGDMGHESPQESPYHSAARVIPHAFSWSEGEGIEVTLSPTITTPPRLDDVPSSGIDPVNDSFQTTAARINSNSEDSGSAHTPASFLLRSPGSSAFLAASSQKKKLKRRNWPSWRGHGRASTASGGVTSQQSGDDLFSFLSSSSSAVASVVSSSATADVVRPAPSWSAQKTWTGTDRIKEDEVFHETDGMLRSPPLRASRSCILEEEDEEQNSSSLMQNSLSSAAGMGQSKRVPSAPSQAGSTHVLLGGAASLSWDVSGASSGTGFRSPAKAFRPSNYKSVFAAGPTQQPLVRHSTGGASLSYKAAAAAASAYTAEKQLVEESHPPPPPPPQPGAPTDFSPLVPNPHSDMAEELKTPQRIEIEREDAIDILACLVERGVSLNHSPPPGSADSSTSTPPTHNTRRAMAGNVGNDNNNNDSTAALDPSPLWTAAVSEGDAEFGSSNSRSMAQGVEDLKELIRRNDDNNHTQENNDGDSGDSAHLELLVDQLLKSHLYALEMSRASKSACSWLKSIGRQQQDSPTLHNLQEEEQQENNDDDFTEKKEDDATTPRCQQHNSIDMDVITTKARLHATEDELATKDLEIQKLNEELAHCRAEIGRIKSSQQAASSSAIAFHSPNRSILDQSEEAEEETSSEAGAPSSAVMGEGGGGGNDGYLDQSFPTGTALFEDKEEEVRRYKLALEEANATIGRLHGALTNDAAATNDHTREQVVLKEPPFVSASGEGHAFADFKRGPEEAGNKDRDMIHVHMLDGENFTTEWGDLSPLPPPPPADQSLRSPLVQSVLESWTEDEGLHESMLSWMDQVLHGQDPETIPPLTISSLDHQVKDGFVLHVLSLLLRRKDILVNVKTRAHRRTTYDIAVSVERPSMPGLDMRRHLETIAARSDVGGTPADSVTHSTTTALMGNGAAFVMNAGTGTPENSSDRPDDPQHPHQQRLMYDEMAEDMDEPIHNTGLMSALGGALGGFLTRNRNNKILPAPTSNGDDSITGDAGSSSPPKTHAAAELDEEQPYHRVVSAPPGRIGVTFVEFRGHAMVSDVAADSPLQGWIFPSDILIAIDELPVSGMRVRDIIAVLKDRIDRQRALRIISCHAMNEIADLRSSSSSQFGEGQS